MTDLVKDLFASSAKLGWVEMAPSAKTTEKNTQSIFDNLFNKTQNFHVVSAWGSNLHPSLTSFIYYIYIIYNYYTFPVANLQSLE